MPKQPRTAGVSHLDSPKSSASSPWNPSPLPNATSLPPKHTAMSLCAQALNNATCLLRIVHVPTFYEMLDWLYQKPTDSFEVEDNRSLALAYSVMALGCMYNVPDAAPGGNPPYELAIEEGLKYYTSARTLLQDITDCRDVVSLQALLFMILFIQSISNLNTCYGYVGIALRSALRMGLHRDLPHQQINVIDVETRRRVFYVCRQMDTYVSALLGFPLLLNDDDIDQPLPTPVDDQFISRHQIASPPPGTPSVFEAFNAHVHLMSILSKIVKYIYPLKGSDKHPARAESPNSSYMISQQRITEMEEELKAWKEKLPMYWRPSPEGPDEVVRVRNLLRFTFAHVQMVLYRPFLHYTSPRMSAGKNVDPRAYACGATGISVARNIVHLGIEMRKQVSLVGPYWFTLFTEFFAVISLVFYVLENQDKDGAAEYWADALAGKQMINSLRRQSMAADRISDVLGALFEQLPDGVRNMKVKPGSSKKRPASDSRSEILMQADPPPVYPGIPLATRPAYVHGTAPAQSLSYGSPMPPAQFTSHFPASFDFAPLGMSAPSPGTTTTTGMHEPGRINLNPVVTGPLDAVHQVDAIMFPSDNPLEYPHRSQADVTQGSGLSSTTGAEAGMGPQDPGAFYVPQLFDDIEGQLLGPLPPYMMQSQARPGYDYPMQMYSNPMLSVHHQVHSAPSRPPDYTQLAATHTPPAASSSSGTTSSSQRTSEASRRVRPRRQPRDVDELLANTPWHSRLPQHAFD